MLATKLRSFEEAFDLLNARFFENALSKSVITIYPTPGAYGHFTPWKSWEGAGGAGYCEINLGAATGNRPVIESIATLVHEMTHQWCYERGVKDTSRGGTYHNKRFKAEAERRGLLIGYDSRIGWSVTKPGPALIAMAEQGAFDACERELHRIGGGARVLPPGGKSESSTRKYVCPCCGMSVRATREVRVMCMDCDEQMVRA